MESQPEIEQLWQAILALETQRQTLGDGMVNAALFPLRQRLAALQSGALGEQRKLVTVLFADLADSTALSAQLDPEEVRELINAYFTLWRNSIERHGGVVEKFIGDAVLAVFGLPAYQEDDPERTILAALDMCRELEQLNLSPDRDPGLRLEMRVGINTGEVVVSTLGERGGKNLS